MYTAVCPIRNVLDQATLLPVISEMLLIHWSAAFGGNLTLVLDQSIIVLLVGRLCGYFVDHVAVYGSSGTFTRSFLSACRCTRSQDRCASPCACSVTQARVVSGTHMCFCLLLAMLFSCLQLALLFSCLQLALLFCSFHSFLRHHPNCPFYPNCVGFSWSCVRSTASLRRCTLFTAPPHALPRAARGLVVSCTTHSPPPRAARVEDVFPELVCSGSSLLSKQLLDSSCVHLT